MLSEEAKRELLAAAASQTLRADFDAMARNVREAGARMSLDDVLAFLTAADAMFERRREPPAHVSYLCALI